MTNSQRLATVRARLTQWLSDRPRPEESPEEADQSIIRESILIRNEFYCGRRFHTADYHAVWFIEEDELKIYRNGGELEAVLSSDELNAKPAEVSSHRIATESEDSPSIIKMPAPLDDSSETAQKSSRESDDQIRRAA